MEAAEQGRDRSLALSRLDLILTTSRIGDSHPLARSQEPQMYLSWRRASHTAEKRPIRTNTQPSVSKMICSTPVTTRIRLTSVTGSGSVSTPLGHRDVPGGPYQTSHEQHDKGEEHPAKGRTL